MASPEGSKVVSLHGDPIFYHDESKPFSPPQEEMCLEQISQHIQTHLGPVATVLHELVSDTVHIDVHVVLPTGDYPYLRLVTSGMSDLPMATPDGTDVPRYAELVITLPPDWKIDREAFEDEAWYWPVRLLKQLARLPHKYDTWLGWGHTMPNGDPAEPYADNTSFDGCILLNPISVPEEFTTLRIDDDKEIAFYAVVPLYKEEMDLKLREGAGALLARFGKKDVSDVFEPKRRNTAKKRFGLF